MTPPSPLRRAACALAAALVAAAAPAQAIDLLGTVAVEGQLLFADYDATGGLGHDDLRVRVDPVAEATGPGVRCSVEASTTALPDELTGLYALSADVRMERGGPQLPEGECILVLRAAGWDGVATSAHAVGSVAATAADLQGGATVVPGVMFARISRASAGLSADCKRYAKKRLKLRDKCNALILKLGGAPAAAKCKDVDLEPAACDEGNHVEAVLGLAHGGNDQQRDVATGQPVDLDALAAQAKCQALFGKAALKFTAALAARIQSECVKPGDDSEACRAQQAAAVRGKLDAIDDCKADPAADGATGRVVPAVGASCDACLAGGTDAKCLKACFELELRALADGLVGDAPVCGDGVLQNGEFCDDGNAADGDGCSALCGVEAP
jgi:cysteine-rich repeat protein